MREELSALSSFLASRNSIQKLAQGSDPCIPEFRVVLDPVIGLLKGFRIQAVDMLSSFLLNRDQLRAAEDVQMLRNGRTAYLEMHRYLARSKALTGQHVQHSAPGRITNRGEYVRSA